MMGVGVELMLVTVTDLAALLVLMAWLPKARARVNVIGVPLKQVRAL